MIPYDYQVRYAAQGAVVLRENMIVYLAMEERTGKTLTAILIAEQLNVLRVLVITKKAALKGWNETLEAFEHSKSYTVTNYHQVSKLNGKYDLVMLDESHNYLSAYPKHSSMWRSVNKVTKDTPIIYISATPHAQGPQQLYGQFAVSSWSPWYKHTNFYRWFQVYGKPYTMEICGVARPQYDRVHNDLVLDTCKHLFITCTRTDLGFEHEPVDEVHYIKLGEAATSVYNQLLKHDMAELSVGTLVCDTSSKLRASLHQLEGGTIKIGDSRFVLGNEEKIAFILSLFGDSKSLVIMYNYTAELIKLETYFKNATILQATSNAEGVDLSMYDNLVIYSQDFSTARHTQRRARQCNKKRDKPIVVHHLLVKKAISEQVYKTVSLNKKNFVDSVFTRNTI